jgi:hypothetical protein
MLIERAVAFFNGQQRRSPLPCPGSLTGQREISQHIAILLAQGGHHRHHTLDKTATRLAMGAKADGLVRSPLWG